MGRAQSGAANGLASVGYQTSPSGLIASPKPTATAATGASHDAWCHGRTGAWPSGNRMKTTMIDAPTSGRWNDETAHASTEVVNGAAAKPCADAPTRRSIAGTTPHVAPTSRNSQPMGLPGRRAARIVPTVEYARAIGSCVAIGSGPVMKLTGGGANRWPAHIQSAT